LYRTSKTWLKESLSRKGLLKQKLLSLVKVKYMIWSAVTQVNHKLW
jgi:hypothetical protein